MFRRIFPTIYVVAAFSLFAFIALAVLQFNQVRSELERERITVLANRTADPFESAALIGLPVSTVRNASALLELARQFDPAIEGAYLFAADGTLLASAASSSLDSKPLGASVGETAQAERSWSGDTADGFYSGVRLLDAAGRVVGGVVITYSGRQSQAQSWAMVGQLLLSGLAFAIVIAPVIWVALRSALRRAIAAYDEVEGQILAFERTSWLARAEPGQGSTTVWNGAPRPLATLLRTTEERYLGEVGGEELAPAPEPEEGTLPATAHALRSRIVLVMLAIISASLLAFSTLVVVAFDRAIGPELESRATLIGGLIRSEMQRTLEFGIPISALGGLSPYLDGVLQDFHEISGIAITARDGAPIAEASRGDISGNLLPLAFGAAVGVRAGVVELPVLVGSQVAGTIRVERSERFVQTRLRDVGLDVSILAIAMLLLGVEVAIATASALVWKPHAQLMQLLDEQRRGAFIHTMRERGPSVFRRLAARLNAYALDIAERCQAPDGTALRPPPVLLDTSDRMDVRLPLFLFALGSEITSSFLPVFASAASRPSWLLPDMAAAAPLVAYLVCVAALSPFGGALSRRFGATRLFLLSVPLATAALAWMALSESVTHIALARGLVAASYALVTVSAQEYTLRADPTASRVRAMSAFVGLILGGTFCGSVIGGVVASRLGFPSAILVGAIFIMAAGIACQIWMRGPAGDPSDDLTSVRGAVVVPADMRRFAALVVGLAIPLSAVTAAYIWYYIPLALEAQGLRPADIARVVMLYYLAAILLGPLVGSAGRNEQGVARLGLAGAMLSGLSLLASPFLTGLWATACVVLAVGAGHALLRSPVYALAIGFGGASPRPMALLRLFERLGSIAGLVAAATLSSLGHLSSLAPSLGLTVVVGAAVFIMSEAALARSGRKGHPC